jgi:NAD+ synthase
LIQGAETVGLRDEVKQRLDLEPQNAIARIVEFIRTSFASSGCAGIVVGLSGGIDSALTATLCVKALGSEKVTGVFMFEERMRNGVDARHAREIADNLRIRTVDLTLDPLIKRFSESFPVKVEDQVARGNLKARMRMVSLYYLANAENRLVAGTGDRSEDLIGYFTKYGDGGVDFLPIAHLYKSQVRFLAEHVGISPEIVEKPSSPNLWEGHKATDEIPLDYSELDRALVCLFDLKMTPEETAKRLGIDERKVRDIVSRFRSSAHKRSYPAMIGSW